MGSSVHHADTSAGRLTITRKNYLISTMTVIGDYVDEEKMSVDSVNIPPRRKKKKKPMSKFVGTTFADLYKLSGDILGEGSSGVVQSCKSVFTGVEYAVKIIEKKPGTFVRRKLLKEIEIYHMCQGQKNITQLVEFFEEDDKVYLVFEKLHGGPLLEHIQRRKFLTESEASNIIRHLAEALMFLHSRGIAHRDLKPDNVLCVSSEDTENVKLCDFDLCSDPVSQQTMTTPTLSTPVGSLEYMAPEVVNTFLDDEELDDYNEDWDDESLRYNKKCDIWSLGVIAYILLCGYAPFQGNCGQFCGWERGDKCNDCQDLLFSNIKQCNVIFPNQQWAGISDQAKDLIKKLLVKDSSIRLTAEQVLSHPWITSQRSTSSVILHTPIMLNQHQESIKKLDEFATKIMEANRALDTTTTCTSGPVDIPAGSLRRPTISFNLTPVNVSNCDLLQRRRRKSKELFSKFLSIDELETDFFMKAIS